MDKVSIVLGLLLIEITLLSNYIASYLEEKETLTFDF
jgi:hypothetical protein